MKPVIVTASARMEIKQLKEALGAVPLQGVGHLEAYRAEMGGREVILALTGIGKVNAACAATLLLERFRPAFLVNTGCGGAFHGCGLDVGDLAIAQSESYPDEGVMTPEGWRGMDLIGIPICGGRDGNIFNTLPLSEPLAAGALAFAARHGYRAKSGPFLTVSTCSGTLGRADELLRRFPGICENMEGAAVAQVALVYGIPVLEVRGVSNMVEDRDLSRWDLKGAVTRAQQFLALYLPVAAASADP